MQTIQLKINDRVLDRFMAIIKDFDKDEIQIIESDFEFRQNKAYLEAELQELENGNAILLHESVVYNRLDNIIKKHEDNF